MTHLRIRPVEVTSSQFVPLGIASTGFTAQPREGSSHKHISSAINSMVVKVARGKVNNSTSDSNGYDINRSQSEKEAPVSADVRQKEKEAMTDERSWLRSELLESSGSNTKPL
ncbi:hypothetical protein L873DRAFT_1786625 [Choiromyces venosus 120613-1]|uniref:Uncharacterized protein n=1 Tax=Choiromyces venosus 120613-1 TaxID=1336337 RepID=A0A3N4K0B4_9PEZI|nr:hypothetical protein L873DRAFT_1786625 [Choiromyces venosus 120613-1]